MIDTTASLGSLVQECEALLARSRVERPRLEARDLVAAVIDKPRFWPTLHATTSPTPREVELIRAAAHKRARGAPFAYAVGKAAFRFLTLSVDERVLIPRPETEQLVERVLAHTRDGAVADIGTGSGAIALALAAEGRYHAVVGCDISADALRCARTNEAQLQGTLQAPVEWRQGAGLAPVRGMRFNAIVSNPPYIAPAEVESLPALVRDWEPAQALSCGEEGLALTRELVENAPAHLHPGGLLALEVDARRAERVARLAEATGAYCTVTVRRDYSGRDRFVLATLAEAV